VFLNAKVAWASRMPYLARAGNYVKAKVVGVS
jgi:hypothetical protein